MNKRIIVCNIVFYFITFFLYSAARQDPSSSLGYGFLLVIFWGAALIALVILLAMKVIRPKSVLDKVGVVMATPICSIILIAAFAAATNESRDSEWHFNNGNHRYKVVKYIFRKSGRTKRIEFYKSVDTVNADGSNIGFEQWIKDSTWIYLSEKGDTLKEAKYKDNVKAK